VKKGCLIVALVLVVLVLAGLGGGAWYGSRLIGLGEAPEVTHEKLVAKDTRLIAVVRPRELLPLIEKHVLPLLDSVPAPNFVKSLMRSYAAQSLPNEIALLGNLDAAKGAYRARLFINERYFGPAVAQFTANPAKFADVIQVNYELPVFTLPERGVLTTERSFQLLRGLDDVVARYWPEDGGEPLRAEDKHLFEVVFDNRTGDLLHVLGARACAQGLTLPEVIKDSAQENTVGLLLALLADIRVIADLTPKHAVEANAQVNAPGLSTSPFHANAALRIGPGLLDALGKEFDTRHTFDVQRLPDLLMNSAEAFTFEVTFDNRSNEFVTLLDNLGLFDTPEMQAANVRQQLEIFKLMTEGRVSGRMQNNGDLDIIWRVDSAPENEGAVYIALGFLPFDAEVLPLLDEFVRGYGMTLQAEPPTMEDGAAFLRRFKVRGFRQNVLNFLRRSPSGARGALARAF